MTQQLKLFKTVPGPGVRLESGSIEAPATPLRELSSKDTGHDDALGSRKANAGAPESAAASGTPLATRLRAFLPLGSLVLTDNHSSIITARLYRGKYKIRIHRCFERAPESVLAGVAKFLQSPKRSPTKRAALQLIRQYFQTHTESDNERRPKRRVILRPVGKTLDLRSLRDEINRQYFDDRISVAITWGRAFQRRRRRCGFSVRLGTYTERDRLVRIHRCLDNVDVPSYVVAAVVYHEMLHAAIPPVLKNGRRQVHTPEFRRRERLFRQHRQAERWIDRNLETLIRF